MCVRRVAAGLSNFGISITLFFFLEPTLALKLSEDFGYTQLTIGLCTLTFFVGMISGNIISLNLSLSIEKRRVVFIGDFIMISGIVCIGPSSLFHLPNAVAIVIVGLVLGGFGRGIINGFPTADAMRGGIRAFPDHETEVTDIISS